MTLKDLEIGASGVIIAVGGEGSLSDSIFWIWELSPGRRLH